MNKNIKWVISITILAFIITIIFSLASQELLKNVGIILGVILIILFILLGVLFDIIGVAVQSANDEPFHAMASKKIKTANSAKVMLKNAPKVSSFCNDVIGDICNIISGSAGVVVSTTISLKYNYDVTIVTLIITSLIAALTIGGKALGKSIAINKSEYIINKVTKLLTIFK